MHIFFHFSNILSKFSLHKNNNMCSYPCLKCILLFGWVVSHTNTLLSLYRGFQALLVDLRCSSRTINLSKVVWTNLKPMPRLGPTGLRLNFINIFQNYGNIYIIYILHRKHLQQYSVAFCFMRKDRTRLLCYF
jgi:hypothetical protein